MVKGGAGEIANDRPQLGPAAVDVTPWRKGGRWGTARDLLSFNRASALISQLQSALTLEQERGTAFLFIPVFLGVGVMIYYALRIEPGLAVLGGGMAALFPACLLGRSLRLFRTATLILLMIVAGMFFAAFETMRAGTKILGDGISTSLTARVLAIEHRENGRIRLTLDLLGTARPTLSYAPERIRVSARAVPPGLKAGDIVTGAASLAPPSGPVRPGGYDFAFRSYFDRIGANGFFLTDPVLAEQTFAPSMRERLSVGVEDARTAIAGRIRARIGGAEGEIAAALIVGTRAGIPENVNEALRRTGLAHILSISGLHMALVAWTVMTVLRLGFALFPGFTSRRPAKKYAAFAALLASTAYLAISGSDVAAERSFIMLSVMLVAILFDHAALTMRNLAIAAIVILVVSPHEMVGPSFQMSFAATAALVGIYARWPGGRKAPERGNRDAFPAMRVLKSGIAYFSGLAGVSLIAGVVTMIYGIYHFQRVSPLSIGANLVVMPVVSILVMPFAVAAMAAMPMGFDGPFLDVMGLGISMMIVAAEWFSRHSPMDAVGTIPALSVSIMTVALLIATLATTSLRWLALPFVVAGLGAGLLRTTPELLISEDARLIGLRMADGRLAVNRARPNGFTVEEWKRVTLADTLAKPVMKRPAGAAHFPDGLTEKDGFHCEAGLCAMRTTYGKLILHTSDADLAAPFCNQAVVLVIDDATAGNPCPSAGVTVITKRDLARLGAAAVNRLDPAKPLEISYALSQAYRPWHHHRQFSRGARGMAAYQRKPRQAEAANCSDSEAMQDEPACRLEQ